MTGTPESRHNHRVEVVGELLTAMAMGGAENLAVQIANTHAEHGGTAHMIVLDGPGPMSERLADNVTVHYLGYKRASIRNPVKFLASIFRGFRLIRKVVRENRIQVLQTHLPDANLWGLAMASTRQCPVVATIHNNLFFGNRENQGWGARLLAQAYQQMFRHCTVVMCSGEVRNSILEGLRVPTRYHANTHVVTNGVMMVDPLPEDEVQAIRQEWGLKPGQTFLLAAGRFTDAKNFGCLLEAMQELGKRNLNPKLLIGGDGPLRPDLEAYVADHGLGDRVMMPGNLSELPRIMQAADCLVMPSRWEGLPLVLLEAMARSLPVVGTRIKGIGETIEDGTHGYLVEVDDPQRLAEAVGRIMENPEKARQLGAAGRQLVEERYGFQRVYQELQDVFAQARERSGRG